MQYKSIFRCTIILCIVFGMLTTIAAYSLIHTLPEDLRYLATQSEAKAIKVAGDYFFSIIVPMIIVFIVITAVGLWEFKSWARKLNVFCVLVFIAFYASIDYLVMNAWEGMFFTITAVFAGMLLAMTYCGEIGKEFGCKSIINNK